MCPIMRMSAGKVFLCRLAFDASKHAFERRRELFPVFTVFGFGLSRIAIACITDNILVYPFGALPRYGEVMAIVTL